VRLLFPASGLLLGLPTAALVVVSVLTGIGLVQLLLAVRRDLSG
jgi:hypothetical protein